MRPDLGPHCWQLAGNQAEYPAPITAKSNNAGASLPLGPNVPAAHVTVALAILAVRLQRTSDGVARWAPAANPAQLALAADHDFGVVSRDKHTPDAILSDAWAGGGDHPVQRPFPGQSWAPYVPPSHPVVQLEHSAATIVLSLEYGLGNVHTPAHTLAPGVGL